MTIVPPTRLEKIQFYENHLSAWLTNAAAIGLTPAGVADFSAAVSAARGAYNAAEMARLASKNATQAYYDAVRTMHSGPGGGASIISTIQSFAQTTGNPNVYTLAEIPAPQPPSEQPAPGTPFDFTVGLLALGELKLGWKCNNPVGTSGTVYEVRRSVNGGASFETIGITGERTFIDATLASGCAQAEYAITGIRSTKRGATSTLTVRFGVGGPTIVSTTTSSGGGDSVRLAA